MNTLLTLAYLFFVGSTSGWCLEVLFRRFVSNRNKPQKWVNPGFCTGPWLPIYGCGLCILFLIVSAESLLPVHNAVGRKVLLFAIMAVAMTAIEYIAGYFSLKYYHVRLWDYSGQRGNIQGIICPLFSFLWAILGAIYYFFIHPHILEGLQWLSRNLAFSFVISLFFGVFLVDVTHSLNLIHTPCTVLHMGTKEKLKGTCKHEPHEYPCDAGCQLHPLSECHAFLHASCQSGGTL